MAWPLSIDGSVVGTESVDEHLAPYTYPVIGRWRRNTSFSARNDATLVRGGLAAIATLVVVLALVVDRSGYDAVVGGVTLLVILLVGLPLTKRFAKAIDSPDMAIILFGALVTKMAFAVIRYIFIYTVYDGEGDAKGYDQAGWQFAQIVRKGDLVPKVDTIENLEDATRRLTKITGYVYAIIGHSQYAAFFIFAVAAFVGLVLIGRGVQIALPEVITKRLYVALLFFPSLLFWPASIGKDAVMVLLLGMSVLGAGLLLAPKARPIGIVPFGLGLASMLMIRPHVGLMSVMAIAVAVGLSVIARAESHRNSSRARFIRALLLIVMVVGSIVAAGSVTRLFDEKAGEATSMQGAFNETLRLTQVGNSKFQPVEVSSPVALPAAVVSVFFRPFPWEVRNVNTLIAGLEGVALLVALVVSQRRLRSIGRLAFRRPIVIFALVYIGMFTVAFSNIGNFGILARQRTQALPLIVLLVALPLVDDVRRDRRDDALGEDLPPPLSSTERSREPE